MLRADVLFQCPLYVHYILHFISSLYKDCISHSYHKYSVAPGVFYGARNTLQKLSLLIKMIMLLIRNDEN